MNNTKHTGHIVDILEKRIFDGCITVSDGTITDICESSSVASDAPYILPGFIDSHVHIESSMLTPAEFSRIAAKHGTVGAVSDPHEIANVLGLDGVRYMIDNAALSSFNFCFGAPSCVPSCSPDFETSGAVLTSSDVQSLLQMPQIGYLSEMMNFPGVLARDPEVIAKIDAAKRLGKPVDGHAPGLLGDDRARYASAGISTDHECTTYDEGLSCVQCGMSVLIREGAAARNFDALIPLIAEYPDKIMFCSDDIHPGFFDGGHICGMVRRALAAGYDLWSVLRAASCNPQLHYNLNWGLLRIGDPATFIYADSLSAAMNVTGTFIKGQPLIVREPDAGAQLPNCFLTSPISAKDIALERRGLCHIIRAYDNQIFTSCETAQAGDPAYPWDQVQKIVVLNRYTPGASPAVGLVRGFDFRQGAMAASVAHDCHNIVAVGASDDDIVLAVNDVIRMKGGIAVVDAKRNITRLELPVAGLMSPLSESSVTAQNATLLQAIADCGCTMLAPLITMSFMCLPVIPQIKLTDKGLLDSARLTPICAACDR